MHRAGDSDFCETIEEVAIRTNKKVVVVAVEGSCHADYRELETRGRIDLLFVHDLLGLVSAASASSAFDSER